MRKRYYYLQSGDMIEKGDEYLLSYKARWEGRTTGNERVRWRKGLPPTRRLI